MTDTTNLDDLDPDEIERDNQRREAGAAMPTLPRAAAVPAVARITAEVPPAARCRRRQCQPGTATRSASCHRRQRDVGPTSQTNTGATHTATPADSRVATEAGQRMNVTELAAALAEVHDQPVDRADAEELLNRVQAQRIAANAEGTSREGGPSKVGSPPP